MKGTMNKSAYFYFAVLLALPFVISNLRMLPTIPGYQFFSFAWLLPKEILMVVLFLVIIVYYFLYGLKNTDMITVGGIALVVLVILFAGVLFGSALRDIVQGLSIVLAPFLIFNTIVGIRKLPFTVEKTIRFLLVVAVINLCAAGMIVALYGLSAQQSPLSGGVEYNKLDIVNGLLSDSHQFTVYFIFITLLTFWKYKETGGRKWFAATVASFLAALLGFNEKAILLFLGLLLLAWMGRSIEKGKLGRVLVVCFLGIFTAGVIGDAMVKLDDRLGVFMEMQFRELPVITPIVDTWDFFAGNPEYAVFGAGFGNYGSPVAVSRTAREGGVPPLARNRHEEALLTLAIPDVQLSEFTLFSFVQIPLKTFTTFLIEMGLIAGSIYFVFFGRLILFHRRRARIDIEMRGLHVVVGLFLVFITAYSFLSIYGSFDDPVATFPAIILSALLYRMQADRQPGHADAMKVTYGNNVQY